jgi:hypothetical protein
MQYSYYLCGGNLWFKVEEPIPVRVMIWIVEILLYLIFHSSYLDLPEFLP